jgi:hypothetical protein
MVAYRFPADLPDGGKSHSGTFFLAGIIPGVMRNGAGKPYRAAQVPNTFSKVDCLVVSRRPAVFSCLQV